MKLKSLLHYLNHRDHLLPKNLNFTKIVLILIICFTLTFSAKNILAQNTDGTTENDPSTISTFMTNEIAQEAADKQEAFDPKSINNEIWTQELAINNAWLIDSSIGGSDVVNMITNPSAWVPGGFIGATNKAVASLYQPPISGTQYIANSINSFVGKPVYASGFQQLAGIQSLWKICRNTVYTLISLVFVAIGLMIMLRIKISPQATVTIQNSIPKIITTLILVTFSYAIIGLIIDLTYLAPALILSLLKDSGLLKDLPAMADLIKGNFNTFSTLTTRVIFTGGAAATTITFTVLTGVVGAIIGLIAAGPAALAGGVIGTLLGVVVGLAILLIFALIQLIKFFFGCAKAYIILLLKIISAPFEIALGAIPNSKMGFGSWFTQTIAYASVFPISLLFLVLLNIILNTLSSTSDNRLWTPGILQGSIITPYIGGIVGLAGLSILAKLPTLIPEAIFQLKPSPFGKAVGEGLSKFPGVGLVRGGKEAIKSGINFYAGQEISTKILGGNNGLVTKMANKRNEWIKNRQPKTDNTGEQIT